MTRRLGAVTLLALGAVAAPATLLAAALGTSPDRLTVSVAATSVPISTCTLVPTDDGWAQGGALGSVDGTGSTLSVRSDALGDRRSFVLFDVASCVPAGARVKTALLRLHLSAAPSASRTYEAQRVSAPWGETSLSFGIGVAGTAVPVSTGTTSGVTLTWDVQPDVAAFAAGAENNGWRIKDLSEGSLLAVTGTFHSREGTDRPQLAVTFYP